MVKLQKPIPKKLEKNPKLDNPIKKKKQEVKKGKAAGATKNVKGKLLESPIKEAISKNKPAKKAAKKTEDVKPKSIQKTPEKVKSVSLELPVSQKTNEIATDKKKGGVVKNGVNEKSAKKGSSVKAGAVVKDVTSTKAGPAAKSGALSKPTKDGVNHKTAPVKPVAAVKATSQVKPDVPAKGLVKSAAPNKPTAPTKPVAEPKCNKALSAAKSSGSLAPKDKSKAPVKESVSKKPVPQIKSKEPVPTAKPQPPAKQPAVSLKAKQNKKAAAAGAPVPSEPKVDKKVSKLQEKKKAKIAFRKAKLGVDTKTSKKTKKVKEVEGEKKKPEESIRYEPIPYDEERFNAIVNAENIKKIAEALKSQVEKEVATKKSSIFDDYRYFLDVGSFKIANCPKRMVKLNLKHTLVDKDDDVLLVVPDLQRGAKVDYEPTIHHYQDMLEFHDVEGNIKVMPMNQLRKEYGTFEQKRRLCASYEHFLCDGRIVSHVVSIIGKIAQKPRTTFHAVRFHKVKEIKSQIEKSLRKTAFRQVAKSSLHSIPVGTHKFTTEQLVENVQTVIAQLKKLFPGGLGNVRNLHLKIDITGTSSLPLYISMAQAPDDTPSVMGPREQRMIKLKRDANEVLSKFALTKEGKLIKLTKSDVEKKRKLLEMRAILKEEQEEEAKKSKKAKKDTVSKDKKDEVKELELPENEEGDDDTDEDDDDVVQLGGSSDDDEEDNDDMGQFDQDEDDDASLGAESETEIVENGLVDESDEESNGEDQEDTEENEEDDGDDDDDDNDDDSEEDEEEGGESD